MRDVLKGKTALVTGAAKRIGRELALALGRAGVNVIVHFRTSEEEAERTVAEARELGVKGWTLQCDLSLPDATRTLIQRALEAADDLDILVNSASVFHPCGLSELDEEHLCQVLRVNALAPLLLSRVFAKGGRKGHILNLLDTRVTRHDPTFTAYTLSKRMLGDLTSMMALEFAPKVQVNGLAPGLVLAPEGKDEGYLKEKANRIPLKRHGNVQGLVNAALCLLRSDFITGQVLFYDGGEHLMGKTYG